jgi:hypothetical protein
MRTQKQIAGLIFVALLGLTLTDSIARAETATDGWQVSIPAYLSAGAYHLTRGNGSHSFNSVNAAAEILLSSPEQPYSAALFVDYHYSPDEQYNGILNAGAYAKYQGIRWDTTAAMFNHDGPESSDLWAYAGRIRYRLVRNHKVGFEFVGALRDPSSPVLSLGYYGDISDTLSIKIVAGANFKTGSQRAARTELVWQFN